MKTKRVALVSFTVLISLSCFAQESQPAYDKDIGFNTTFLLQGIFNSQTTPFSIMYKKYISENKANRFGIDFFLNLNNENNNQGTANYSESSNASVYLNFGREIQKPINPKWTWFYGGDVIPFYEFSNRDDYQNNEIYFTYRTSGFGMTLRPFLAIRYNIDPRLYLSAEASLSLRYRHSTQSSENHLVNIVEYNRQGNNISFHPSPASGLFLYYRF